MLGRLSWLVNWPASPRIPTLLALAHVPDEHGSMQFVEQGKDVSRILVGMTAEQYVRMLTSDNMTKLIGLLDPGQHAGLLAARDDFQADVKALVAEEAALHNQIKALAAAALVHVGLMLSCHLF